MSLLLVPIDQFMVIFNGLTSLDLQYYVWPRYLWDTEEEAPFDLIIPGAELSTQKGAGM